MLYRSYQQKSFLVIDDFDSFVISMKQMLRRLGAESVDSARNGDEAIQLCLKRHYDVVFCDYNMGDSHKNGQQVLEELRFRKLLKNTDLFIVVSAEAAKDMVMGALEYQPDGYITKPITQSLLQNRLDKMIAQKIATMEIDRAIDAEDYARAITLTNTQLGVDPKNRAWLVRTLGNLHYQTGDYAKARKIFTDVLEKRPVEWARMGQGKCLFMEGNIREAMGVFEALIADSPQLIGAYDWLARCQRELGENKAAQETLLQATQISPRAILRQQELATLSRQLNDLETAAKAYKASSRLSDKSCYDSSDLHLNYSRTLTELAETAPNPKEAVRMAQDAVQALDPVRRRFNDSKAHLQSFLVEARANTHQKNPEASERALKKARELFKPEEMAPEDTDIVLEMAETLYCLNMAEDADGLLKDFAQRFPDNPGVASRVEEMLEEPVSSAQRHKARTLNREGITLYEQEKLDEAIALFQKALEITPKQPGLNLNYLQALLKQINNGKHAGPIMALAEPALASLEGLSEKHRQYKRYQQILKRFQALKNG